MTELATIDVNEHGEDIHGNDYTVAASVAALVDGLVTSTPVMLRYPDGQRERGFDVRLTPKGMQRVRREMKLDEGR